MPPTSAASAPAEPSPSPAAHQGRWGFYPCDHATFLEVKEYHRLFLRAYCQHKRWLEWDRKTVYRPEAEPARFAAFSATFPRRIGSIRYAFADFYAVVLHGYRQVRHPAATPDKVTSLPTFGLPPEWREELDSLREHYAAQPA